MKSIDGSQLYIKYRGAILVAVEVDANDRLFHLSFTIVEGKNNDSWGWFMTCIRESDAMTRLVRDIGPT